MHRKQGFSVVDVATEIIRVFTISFGLFYFSSLVQLPSFHSISYPLWSKTIEDHRRKKNILVEIWISAGSLGKKAFWSFLKCITFNLYMSRYFHSKKNRSNDFYKL